LWLNGTLASGPLDRSANDFGFNALGFGPRKLGRRRAEGVQMRLQALHPGEHRVDDFDPARAASP